MRASSPSSGTASAKRAPASSGGASTCVKGRPATVAAPHKAAAPSAHSACRACTSRGDGHTSRVDDAMHGASGIRVRPQWVVHDQDKRPGHGQRAPGPEPRRPPLAQQRPRQQQREQRLRLLQQNDIQRRDGSRLNA